MQENEKKQDINDNKFDLQNKLKEFDFLQEVSEKVDTFSTHRTTIIEKTSNQI